MNRNHSDPEIAISKIRSSSSSDGSMYALPHSCTHAFCRMRVVRVKGCPEFRIEPCASGSLVAPAAVGARQAGQGQMHARTTRTGRQER